VDIKTLEVHLKNISPDIQLVNHQDWQTQVLSLIQTSVIMALTVTFLVLLAAIATTSFATHTSLLIHRQVIEVLSLIGATNAYIAKQFQMHALKQGLVASAVGSGCASLTFLGITFLLEKAGFPFFISTSFLVESICVFVLIPLLTASAMMFSARWAVMKELRP
jgi:cell division transport system permease protein